MKLAFLCTLALFLAAGCVEVRHRVLPEEGSPCTSSRECPLQAPACDVGNSGTCVQCVPGDAAACVGKTPVCGDAFECRPCQAHADCASNACLPDGSCGTAEQVIYLSQAGAGTACTKAAPCSSFESAMADVTSTRRFIRLSGTVTGADKETTKPFTLLGEPGAALRAGLPRALLELRAAGTYELYDVVLSPLDIGISLDNGASLILQRSKIQGSRGDGLLIRSGSATVAESEISGGSLRGISLQSGVLDVSRSSIFSNTGGGILIGTGQRFSITNSFIVGNNGFGGVSAQRPGANSRLDHNTIADNRNTGMGTAEAGGVVCDDATIIASNNIIYRNLRVSGTAQTFGACKFISSYVSAGTGGNDSSLGFRKDTVPRDYHLTEASPATVRDVATAVCTGLVDFDGEQRPQGGACELGADEVN
jgi:Right handed beta helix region